MAKTKSNILKSEGIVLECLPGYKYRVRLKNDKIVLAYLCGNMIRNHISLMRDDKVILEFSIYDSSRARIMFRK